MPDDPARAVVYALVALGLAVALPALWKQRRELPGALLDLLFGEKRGDDE